MAEEREPLYVCQVLELEHGKQELQPAQESYTAGLRLSVIRALNRINRDAPLITFWRNREDRFLFAEVNPGVEANEAGLLKHSDGWAAVVDPEAAPFIRGFQNG